MVVTLSALAFDSNWMSPVTCTWSMVTPPPCLTWMLPPTVDIPLTVTFVAPTAWRLPPTATPPAASVALTPTVMFPSMRVPFSVHVAPAGTSRFS